MKKFLIAVAVALAVEAAACIMKVYNDSRFEKLEALKAHNKNELELLELRLEWVRKGNLAY